MASEETKDPTSNPTEERLAKVDGLVWRRYVDDAGVFGVLHMSHREWLRPSDVSPRAACVAWYPDGASAPEVLWWTEAKALGAVGDGIRLSCGDRGRTPINGGDRE